MTLGPLLEDVHFGAEEMRTEQGWSFVSLTAEEQKQENLQPRHSSACRGAFFRSCKMEGEGCENNDPSTYYRFMNCIKKNLKLFPKSFMFCKAFSLF